jgi:Protein of unknown function (DUF4199)
MKKIVLTFGLISGSIFIIMLPLAFALDLGHGTRSIVVGYTTMFFAFLLVFFGIRSYRDNVGGGSVTFGKAFQVGILIALIASAMYVITWEVYYFNFAPDFIDKYAEYQIAQERAAGASEAAIAVTRQKMAEFKTMYANPLFNVGMTFVEVFPLGLVMTLISAAILRKKNVGFRTAATAS